MGNKLGIQINNTWLDVLPGTVLDFESNSPYFMHEDLDGEFSLPFSLPITTTNNKIFSQQASFSTNKDNLKFEALIYDGNNYVTKGFLYVESVSSTIERQKIGVYNVYFVGSSSYLFTLLKDIKLSTVCAAYSYSFNFTTIDPTDNTNGWWQHIHNTTVQPNNYPYVFYPIRNDNFRGNEDPASEDYMNKVLGNGFFDPNRNIRTLCPALRYKWLLEAIVLHLGWRISGDVLTDAAFITATMPSLQNIPWATQHYILDPVPNYYNYIPYTTINFNLGNYVPEWTCAKFILELCKLFNWGINIDFANKTIVLSPLKAWRSNESIDLTTTTNPAFTHTNIEAAKIYALQRLFDSNDAMVKAPDFTGLTIDTAVPSYSNLPALVENKVVLVIDENNYYVARSEDDGAGYLVLAWRWLASNIYNYEPANFNANINFEITPISTTRTYYHDADINDLAILPIIKQRGNWQNMAEAKMEWQPRILFYLGLLPTLSTTNTATIPTASHVHPNYTLGWENYNPVSQIDKGFLQKWWNGWIDFIGIANSWQLTQYPNYAILQQYSFKKLLIVRSVGFLLKKIKYQVPHSGKVEVEAVRLS